MAVKYDKFFQMLFEQNMSKTELMERAEISANIFTRMRREGYIAMDTIEKICFALDCKVDDILEFIPNEKEDK